MYRWMLPPAIALLVIVAILPAQPAVQSPILKKPEVKPPAAAVEKRYSAFNSVQLAAIDMRGVAVLNDPELETNYIRYISLYNKPRTVRDIDKENIDWILNSLSQNALPIRAAWADPDHVVVRVNLHDYGISPKNWDTLVEKGSGSVPLGDGYFHNRQRKLNIVYEDKEEYVYGADGKAVYDYQKQAYKTHKIKTKVKETETFITTSAEWLAIEPIEKERGSAISYLVSSEGCGTKNPIVRGDWFAAYASTAPGYYVMLGLDPDKSTVKDVEKLANLNEKRAERSKVVAISDTRLVTFHNRIFVRYPTEQGYTGGSWWSSFDTNRGVDAEDYMDNLHSFDKPKFQAQEIIFNLLNGMQAYAVVDDKGKLQNFAIQSVAMHSDRMPTKLQDKTVWTGLRNCGLCHPGLQPIDCKVRALAQGNIAVFLTNYTKNNQYTKTLDNQWKRNFSLKFREAFQPDINSLVAFDDARYAASLAAVNGRKPRPNVAAFEQMLYTYLEEPISLEIAAMEAGVDAAFLEKALGEGVNLHWTLTAMLQQPPLPVPRLVWERVGYSALMDFLISYQPRPAPLPAPE